MARPIVTPSSVGHSHGSQAGDVQRPTTGGVPSNLSGSAGNIPSQVAGLAFWRDLIRLVNLISGNRLSTLANDISGSWLGVERDVLRLRSRREGQLEEITENEDDGENDNDGLLNLPGTDILPDLILSSQFSASLTFNSAPEDEVDGNVTSRIAYEDDPSPPSFDFRIKFHLGAYRRCGRQLRRIADDFEETRRNEDRQNENGREAPRARSFSFQLEMAMPAVVPVLAIATLRWYLRRD